MIEVMFDHNLQYREFVYIFEDFDDSAEPHTPQLEENLKKAEELSDQILDEFLSQLVEKQDSTSATVINNYVSHLKNDIEPKNGGFPNTPKMVRELFKAVKMQFDDASQDNFDLISEDLVNDFKKKLADKLDLDKATREWMDKQIDREQDRQWLNGDQEHHPHHFDLSNNQGFEQAEDYLAKLKSFFAEDITAENAENMFIV